MKYTYDIAAIRRAMLAKGWTEKILADRAKMAASTLNSALRKNCLSPVVAAKVAKALGLKLESLVIPVSSDAPQQQPAQEGAAA